MAKSQANFSALLPPVAQQELGELTKKLGIKRTQVVIRAIHELYKQEINMNTQTSTLTILNIETKPEHDPYVNIEGVVSRTFLKLDPRDHTVWVNQEYQDNSTPSDEWHGLVLTWNVNSHPSENEMRQWINDNLSSLTAICDGYDVHWNGHNHVGHLTDDARNLVETFQWEFDNDAGPRNYYEYWQMEDWVQPDYETITADSTDEELRILAQQAITALDSNQILDRDENDIFKYYLQRRNDLKDE